MECLRDSVYDIVSLRVRGTGGKIDDDVLLESIIEESEFKIKNYCWIKTIPYELKYVWANIATDYYTYLTTIKDVKTQGSDLDGGIDYKPTMGNIRTVKEGDTTIEAFDRADTEDYQKAYLQARKLNLDYFLYNYVGELQDFRRMKGAYG